MSLEVSRRLLEVDKNADLATLKSAYRNKAKLYHPDLNQGDSGAARKFQEITDAYERLKKHAEENEARQKHFKRSGQTQDPRQTSPNSAASFFYEDDGDRDEIFERIFETIRRKQPWNPSQDANYRFDSGSESHDNANTQSKPDHRVPVYISLEEAFRGEQVIVTNAIGQRVQIKVPVGAKDGLKLRIKPRSNSTGDAATIVTLNVKKHGSFILSDDKLKVTLDIPFTKFLLGGDVSFTHLDGKVRTLKLRPSTPAKAIIILKGEGWPESQQNTVGDLHVELTPSFPTHLSDNQRDLLQALEDSL